MTNVRFQSKMAQNYSNNRYQQHFSPQEIIMLRICQVLYIYIVQYCHLVSPSQRAAGNFTSVKVFFCSFFITIHFSSIIIVYVAGTIIIIIDICLNIFFLNVYLNFI